LALESQRDRATNTRGRRSPQTELPLFAPTSTEVSAAAEAQAAADATLVTELKGALEALDPDSLSPRAALDAIYRLRELLTRYS